MTYHQICFTRVSGQGGTFGWQAVNASPGLSQDAVAAFTLLQNANINPPKFDSEDDRQFVLELQTDGTNVFYTGIKCNVGVDDRGRSIMFAHSFVFDLNEYVKRPQDVLAVTDDNFRFSIEETTQVPETLAKYESLSLKDCVSAIGLTEERYTTLMQCVFQLLSAKTKSTLHIVCDCQPQTIRNFMTCIYLALPFELRKLVSFSTHEFPNGLVRTIVFDRRQQDDGRYFFHAESGENNLLTESALRRLSKYDFISIIPRTFAAGQADDAYFDALTEKLWLFDSAHTTSLELYKIAADLLSDDQPGAPVLTQEQLCTRLNELLSAPVSHPYLDQQIQYILADIIERHIILNDVLSEKLCRKLETTQNQDLIECGYLYNSEKISRMGVEDGAKYLFEAYHDRNSESFLSIRALLDHDPKGKEILNHLYVHLVAGQLPMERESIVSFHAETQSLCDRERIQECIYQLVCSYAKEVLVPTEKYPILLINSMEDILFIVLDDRPDLQKQARDYVKRQYWNCFNYEDFDIEAAANYEKVIVLDDNRCLTVFAIFEIYKAFQKNDYQRFTSLSQQYLQQESPALSKSDRAIVVKKLLSACVSNKSLIGETELDIWLSVSNLLIRERKNPVRFLLKKHIHPIYYNFEEAYPASAMLQDEIYRDKFTEWLTECVQDKADYSKTASEVLRVMKEAEKRARQDKKRQERDERREAKGAGEKGSLISGFTGLFKRKSDDKKDDWS